MRADLILTSWLRTKRAMRLSAAGLAQERERQWRRLQPALARTPALAPRAGRPLADFPITEAAEWRANPEAWNSVGLGRAEIIALADAAESGGGGGPLSAGWSSGSGGGARGLFLASAAERADYIGQSLARLLPARALLRRQRLALHLRASNALYADVRGRRFAFAHFPLEVSPAETAAALEAFRPTILIAPPHRLAELAARGVRLPALRHLCCGSEPIGSAESEFISDCLGLRPRNIYQATEGFLGAECRKGRLHLNDHSLEIELDPIAGTGGFRPVITDLRRSSQPIVRLRGDDYLEADPDPCPCGFGGRVIYPPQGRVSDIWYVPGAVVTPPQVVAAVERALGGAAQWQAEATPLAAVLRVSSCCPDSRAREAAAGLAKLTGGPVSIEPGLAPWRGPKWHKVIWNHG